VWRLLGWRTMVQQNLGNVQPGQMCSDTRVAESPKKVTNRSKAFAVYGSPTPYTLMEVATSVVQPYEPSSQSQLSRTKVGPPTMSLNFRVSTYIAAKHSGMRGRTAAWNGGRAWQDRYADSGVPSNGVARRSSRFL